MVDNLITFETAKLAKEKGFNVPTLCFYGLHNKSLFVLKNGELLNLQNHNDNELVGKNRASSPTQSLLQKWLREVHNTIITPLPTKSGWFFNIQYGDGLDTNFKDFDSNNYYITYEEALEVGLQEALKLIKFDKTK